MPIFTALFVITSLHHKFDLLICFCLCHLWKNAATKEQLILVKLRTTLLDVFFFRSQTWLNFHLFVDTKFKATISFFRPLLDFDGTNAVKKYFRH